MGGQKYKEGEEEQEENKSLELDIPETKSIVSDLEGAFLEELQQEHVEEEKTEEGKKKKAERKKQKQGGTICCCQRVGCGIGPFIEKND